MFLTQLRNELLKLFARKRTYIGFGAFLVVELLILFLAQLPKAKKGFEMILTKNGYGFESYYFGLSLGTMTIIFTGVVLGGIYLALVSGDMVAKEVEDGTMRMILSRPISRLRLIVLKWIACVLYTFSLIFFIAITSVLAGTLYRGGLGNLFIWAPQEQVFALFNTREGAIRLTEGVILLSLTTQIISTMGFMFSCFNMKPAAATILTLSVLFIDFVLRNVPYFYSVEEYFITYHTAAWVRIFRDIIPWWDIVQSLLYLLAMNITCLVIAAMNFCSRDFKS
jgi:ABC-2 type transport system permease protein